MGAAIGAIARAQTEIPIQEDDPLGTSDYSDRNVEPVASGSTITVASGNNLGAAWTLTAYNSNQGLCTDLNIPSTMVGSTGACGGGIPTSNQISLQADAIAELGGTFVYGEVSRSVSSVKLTFDNGKVIDIAGASFYDIDSPTFNVRFFVATVPALLRLSTATAIGENGVPIQTVTF